MAPYILGVPIGTAEDPGLYERCTGPYRGTYFAPVYSGTCAYTGGGTIVDFGGPNPDVGPSLLGIPSGPDEDPTVYPPCPGRYRGTYFAPPFSGIC